jgi:chloramphenicol-sensitive protein RarD
LGALQYIAPILHLLSGRYFSHESFRTTRAALFAVIWLALLIYAVDGLWRSRSVWRASAADGA